MRLPRPNELASKRTSTFLWTTLALAACTAPKQETTNVHEQALGLVACNAGDNRIVCENRQRGEPNWQLTRVPNLPGVIEGYASQTSVNNNEPIGLFINVGDAKVQTGEFEVFRMGWYGGAGARRVYPKPSDPMPSFIPSQQPTCPETDPVAHLVECRWTSSLQRPLIPDVDFASSVSGYYLVRLSIPTLATATAQWFIIFVVRNDTQPAMFLMNSPVTTYQAYNEYGNRSFYSKDFYSTKVSFDRPYIVNQGAGNFFDTTPVYPDPNDPLHRVFPQTGWEYPMVRFLEGEGYDVTYATDIDLHRRPDLLTNTTYPRNAFLSVGHDEYWSKGMHDNLGAARDLGKHIGFFSGNSVFWNIKFLPSTTPTSQYPGGVPNRVIETHKNQSLDPNPNEQGWPNPWLWQNCAVLDHVGSFNPPRCIDTGEESEQTLVGSITTDGVTDRGDMVFADADFNGRASWVLQGTGLKDGSRIPGMIGYEAQTVCGTDTLHAYDCVSTQTFRAAPAGQTIFARSRFKARPSTSPPPEYLWANMSVYKASTVSGWVFSSGSPDWSLGLAIYNPNFLAPQGYYRVHPAIAQMTRNVLAQFGDPRSVVPISNDAYTVSVSQPNPPLYHLSWTNLPGRPAGDFVALHAENQNDDLLIHYGPRGPNSFCSVNPGRITDFCDVPAPPGGTSYIADYVTLDLTWRSLYEDQLRTIWRAAKSFPPTFVP